MEGLSFEKMPHYHFSSNRQFKKGECHLDRIYELSVLLLVRKGILRFTENGIPIEVKEGEYYIQKANLYQQGVIPSDEPNYYFIHFSGHYSNAGALPIRGNFSFDKIQPIIMQIELLSESAERLEKEALFYALLCELKKGSGHKSTAEQIRTFLLSNYKKDINLSDLSKNFYLSKNQIINVFKNTYNTTPFQYLLNFRLTKAG